MVLVGRHSIVRELHRHVDLGLCAGEEMRLLSHFTRLLHVLSLEGTQLARQLLLLALLASNLLRNFLLLFVQREQFLALRDLIQQFHGSK